MRPPGTLLHGGPALHSGLPPRTPPRRAAMPIMCGGHEHMAMSNVSAPVFLEELERSGGSAACSKCPLRSAPAQLLCLLGS